MIKSNHSFIKCEQESTLEFRFYTLVALIIIIIIKAITIFTLLLMMITNLTLIDHASVQKISQWQLCSLNFNCRSWL